MGAKIFAYVDMDEKKIFLWPELAWAVVALLLAGSLYRVAASRLEHIETSAINLPVPLTRIFHSFFYFLIDKRPNCL